MLTDNLLYLPVSEKKFNKFSITMNDRLHEQVLAVASQQGSRRAPTATDLIELGLQAYSQETGFDLSDESVKKYLEDCGVAKPSKHT